MRSPSQVGHLRSQNPREQCENCKGEKKPIEDSEVEWSEWSEISKAQENLGRVIRGLEYD